MYHICHKIKTLTLPWSYAPPIIHTSITSCITGTYITEGKPEISEQWIGTSSIQ